MTERIALQEKAIKRIRLMGGERVEVGIDVHKRTYSITLWSEQRESVVFRWTQPSDVSALIRSMAPLREHVGRVVYEAGPTGYALVRALREAGFEAEVIAPSRTPKSSGQEAKSDRGHGPAARHHSLAHQPEGRDLPAATNRGDDGAGIVGHEEEPPAWAAKREAKKQTRRHRSNDSASCACTAAAVAGRLSGESHDGPNGA